VDSRSISSMVKTCRFIGSRMRRISAQFSDGLESRVHRVVEFDDVSAEWMEDQRFLVLAKIDDVRNRVSRLQKSGLDNVGWVSSEELNAGDVIIPQQAKSNALVLYRESDLHHSLFMTNRCNSNCLMCSQPPTKHDDSWLVDEALDVIHHLRKSPETIGLSGGEPLLLGSALRLVLDAITIKHPSTRIEVLTNGRLFSNSELARQLTADFPSNVSWLVPLYGHADFIHDFIVQAPGAFEETISGLLNLQELQQQIQLRIVLIEPVLRILPELCSFIGRNLPFVREVALMACEPIGFALANRELCDVDLTDWSETLEKSAKVLRRNGIPYLFMNAPLCALPSGLWPSAHKSISDWKNVYLDECNSCCVKENCSGLFAWHERGWKPTKINAIKESIS
jgi:His-Xaa-Ser system radical SAM maturase HxsC